MRTTGKGEKIDKAYIHDYDLWHKYNFFIRTSSTILHRQRRHVWYYGLATNFILYLQLLYLTVISYHEKLTFPLHIFHFFVLESVIQLFKCLSRKS